MAGISLYGLLNTGMLGVYTHKLAMSVVGHNIANTNTPGYSRQRAIIQSTPPIPVNTLTQPNIPIQFGTGSMIKDIQRVRDSFLDVQYRETKNRVQYWDTIYGNMHYIEQLFAEPGDTGLRALYDEMWAAMQEIVSDPTNEAVKGQIVARAVELSNTMKDLDYRLEELQKDINTEIFNSVDQFNSYFNRIADLNTKIRSIQLMGTSPNDLLDERDRLVDDLSSMCDIKVDNHKNGEVSLRIGDRVLVHGGTYMDMKAYLIPGTDGLYSIYANNQRVNFNGGTLGANFEIRDQIIPEYRQKLDEFAINVVDTMNLIHQEGWDSTGSITGTNFFKDISATTDAENARIFRIASNNFLINGPVDSVSSNRNFKAKNLGDIFLNNDWNLVASSSQGTQNITFEAGKDLASIMEFLNISDPDHPDYDPSHPDYTGDLKFDIRFDYSPTEDLLRIVNENGNSLNNKLLIDENKTLFRELGFKTKEIKSIKFNEENFVPGKFDFNINGEKININFEGAADVDDFITAVNSQSNGYLQAFKGDSGNIYMIPTEKVNDFDISTIVLNDSEGIFSQMTADTIFVDALDTSEPSLNNIFGIDHPIEIEINGIKKVFDPFKNNLNDVITGINQMGSGINAYLTPNGRFVLKAGATIDFDIRNSNIKGTREFFEKIGFIPEGTSTAQTVQIMGFDFKMDRINEMFKNANMLKLDNGLGLVQRVDVTEGLKANPSNLAIDLGKGVSDSWGSVSFSPVGPSNPSVWVEISKLSSQPILNDGKDGFSGYLATVIAEMGIKGETANKMLVNNRALNQQIDGERERVKGVSLDEEMSNMIKYQQAFNAAARVITAVDEMIGRIVNNLGTVGR